MKPFVESFRRYARDDERGAITALMLILFIGILLMTGIALDMARHETERADLQSAIDRGVLAAASLNQPLDPETVVQKYVENRNFSDNKVVLRNVYDYTGEGDPLKDTKNTEIAADEVGLDVAVYLDGLNGRQIGAAADYSIGTSFLRMAGVTTLGVGARAEAIQRKTDVEISLVLDISGTMRWNANTKSPADGKSRLELLKPAAKEFVDTVLGVCRDPSTGAEVACTVDTNPDDQVSLSVVPYAGNVNPGPVMFERLGGERYATEVDGSGNVTREGNDVSSCLELRNSDFPSADPSPTDPALGLPAAGSYEQVPHFNVWGFSNSDDQIMDWGWCPRDTIEPDSIDGLESDEVIIPVENNTGMCNARPGDPDATDGSCDDGDTTDLNAGTVSVRYISSDAASLREYIDELVMHDGTGTYIGMKYGLALLNPSARDDIKAVKQDPGYTHYGKDFHERPAEWTDPDSLKVIVLMTDGNYNSQYRPNDELASLSEEIDYGEGEDQVDVFHPRNQGNVGTGDSFDHLTNRTARFLNTCAAAKKMGTKIYAIAFDVNSNWMRDDMKACSSGEAGYYYEVTSDETDNTRDDIRSAFQKIAGSIQALRLKTVN